MENKTHNKGYDIWKRARTNAFAHKLKYEQMMRNQNLFFCIQTVAVVLPIVFSGIISESTSNAALIKNLSIISVISGGVALLLGILISNFNFQEKKMNHKKMVSDYSLLAQRARRLFEDSSMEQNELKIFQRFLEESFEIHKATGEEPSNRFFIKASKILEQMNVQPKIIID